MNNIQKQNQKKKRKGFTLIELIIVLAVMAIIAAIAIPNFAAVRNNSKNKADVQSSETIKRTVLMLVSDGSVPTPAAKATYTASFANDKISKVADAEDKDNTIIKEALQEVKAPQGKTFTMVDGKATHTTTDAKTFVITVDEKGSVEVVTGE